MGNVALAGVVDSVPLPGGDPFGTFLPKDGVTLAGVIGNLRNLVLW